MYPCPVSLSSRCYGGAQKPSIMLVDGRRRGPLFGRIAWRTADFLHGRRTVPDLDIHLPHSLGRLEQRGCAKVRCQARRTDRLWEGQQHFSDTLVWLFRAFKYVKAHKTCAIKDTFNFGLMASERLSEIINSRIIDLPAFASTSN